MLWVIVIAPDRSTHFVAPTRVLSARSRVLLRHTRTIVNFGFTLVFSEQLGSLRSPPSSRMVGIWPQECARTIENISRIRMVVTRASGSS